MMNYFNIQYLLLAIATLNHAIATLIEQKKQPPPGKLIDLGGYKVHLYSQGEHQFNKLDIIKTYLNYRQL